MNRSGLRLFEAVAVGMLIVVLAACSDKNPASGTVAKKNAPKVVEEPPSTRFAQSWNKRTFNHGLWDAVLTQYVDDRGLVDYAGIAESKTFSEYLYRLSKTNAAGLRDDHERLAFWINAYNALMIRGLLDVLPKDRSRWSDFDVQAYRIGDHNLWKGLSFSVGGGRWTLDEIENEILRKQDGLRDPRIHVALVCGALGCPPLWNHAYIGQRVEKQLHEALKRFVGNSRLCDIQMDRGVIRISKIFQWYAGDFVNPQFSPHANSVPAFLAMGIDDPDVAGALQTRHWRMDYFEYNWKLNLNQSSAAH